jgi:hypothetical protein
VVETRCACGQPTGGTLIICSACWAEIARPVLEEYEVYLEQCPRNGIGTPSPMVVTQVGWDTTKAQRRDTLL